MGGVCRVCLCVFEVCVCVCVCVEAEVRVISSSRPKSIYDTDACFGLGGPGAVCVCGVCVFFFAVQGLLQRR